MDNKRTEFDEAGIKLLVDCFYDKARKHPEIGPIFDSKIKDQWDSHFEKLYRFWETHLTRSIKYTGSPMPKHEGMELKPAHFEVWINLFYETIDELFEGDASAQAKRIAGTFVNSFKRRL